MAEMNAVVFGVLVEVLGRFLLARALESLSAALLPGMPLWPGHHWVVIFIDGKLWNRQLIILKGF